MKDISSEKNVFFFLPKYLLKRSLNVYNKIRYMCILKKEDIYIKLNKVFAVQNN